MGQFYGVFVFYGIFYFILSVYSLSLKAIVPIFSFCTPWKKPMQVCDSIWGWENDDKMFIFVWTVLFSLITTDGTWSNLLHGRLGSVDNTGYSLRVHIVVGEIFWVCFGACLWQYEPKPVAHISRGLSLRGKRRIFNHWYSLRYLYIFTGAARPGKIICQKKS